MQDDGGKGAAPGCGINDYRPGNRRIRGPLALFAGMEDAAHGQYTAEELEFMQALDRYKRQHQRPHPSWAEVLAVAKSLGYRKQADAGS